MNDFMIVWRNTIFLLLQLHVVFCRTNYEVVSKFLGIGVIIIYVIYMGTNVLMFVVIIT